MATSAEPIPLRERILTLDVIRGFALLGILIMNVPYFNTSFFAGADGTEPYPQWWDQTAATLRDVLFSGKFNSMFSMLFAVGFTIQLARLEQRDPQHAKSVYLRRIGWLFIFGAIHACVFWTGDILHIYALFGLLLLALRRAPEKLLWTLAALCLLLPVAIGLYRLATVIPADIARNVATAQQWEASNNAAYGSGSFFAAAREHTREMIFGYTNPASLRAVAVWYSQLFTTMILGLILGRRRFFQNVTPYLPLVKRLQWWALALGVVTGVVFGYWEATVVGPPRPTPFRVVANVCYFVSRISIMVFYVALIVRMMQNAKWQRRFASLAIVGRMPLTNYLLQTLIATFLFYGWGLGLWLEVGSALDLVLAFAIFFVVQVPLTKLWLRHFDLGPMEFLWRYLTYGHATLLRASGAPAPSSESTLLREPRRDTVPRP